MRNKEISKHQLANYTGADEIVTSQQLYHELKATKKNVFSIRFKSQFPTLMKTVEGFQEGELIILSGPTKGGKTLLSQSFTYAFAQNGIDCLFLSYEVPTRQFLDSFPKDALPKFLMPRQIHACSIDWFEARALEAFEKYRAKVVFIDHLHFLFDMARVRNPSLEIGAYVRRLKRFAVLHGLVIFLLCHIHKLRPDEEINYNHLRDSSFIAQESDSVFFVRRLKGADNKINNEAELKVDFHRRTGVLGKKINLVKVHGYLQEQQDKWGKL